MRMARLACELELEVDAGTRRLARESAARITEVAAERSFYELRRLLSSEHPLNGLELMDEATVTQTTSSEPDDRNASR